MSWYAKQSSDLLKTASNDADLLMKPTMLRRQSINSKWKVLIMASVMAFNIADGFIN